jgi:cytochrome oxidase assembly protein ShyY1
MKPEVMNHNKFLSQLFTGLAVLILATGSVELGIWQLHRAREVQQAAHPTADSYVYPLSEVATAGTNLTSRGVNKLVSIQGSYIHSFIAQGQSFNPSKNISSENTSVQVVAHPVVLDVRLMKVENTNQNILVVRGVYKPDRGVQLPATIVKNNNFTIVGRYYPRQNNNATQMQSSVAIDSLSRIDPALVANIAPGKLFDGYVVESSEAEIDSTTGALSHFTIERLPTPLIAPPSTGYYWQHIAYVVIWWLLSLLILISPFYNVLRKKFAISINQSIKGDHDE